MIKNVQVFGLIVVILLIAGCMTNDTQKPDTAKDDASQKANTVTPPTINVTDAMATTKDLQDLLSPTK